MQYYNQETHAKTFNNICMISAKNTNLTRGTMKHMQQKWQETNPDIKK